MPNLIQGISKKWLIRGGVATGLITMILIMHKCSDNDDTCKEAAVKEGFLLDSIAKLNTRNALWADSIAAVNAKLDDCRGGKKTVKAVSKSTSVRRPTGSSSSNASATARATSGTALVNFYDNSKNEAGGIIINVTYDSNGQIKTATVQQPGNSKPVNVQKSAPATQITAPVEQKIEAQTSAPAAQTAAPARKAKLYPVQIKTVTTTSNTR